MPAKQTHTNAELYPFYQAMADAYTMEYRYDPGWTIGRIFAIAERLRREAPLLAQPFADLATSAMRGVAPRTQDMPSLAEIEAKAMAVKA